MKWLKAATNTHREAASSSQLAAAHPMARRVRERSFVRAENRSANRSTRAVVLSASRNRMWRATRWMTPLARC
jgi:hypothetical protein